jgi:hypothetical protein
MNSPAIDMKNLLVNAGLGTNGLNPNAALFSLYVGKEPDTPDNVITLYDTPGESPNPKWRLDYPRFQVRVRSKSYPTCYDKAEEVKSHLLGLPSQTISGIRYVGVYVVIDTGFLMTDQSNRVIFTSTWRVIREPNVGVNRRAL